MPKQAPNQIGPNVTAHMEGDILVLRVDTSKRFENVNSGKEFIGSSGGWQAVEGVRLNLHVSPSKHGSGGKYREL